MTLAEITAIERRLISLGVPLEYANRHANRLRAIRIERERASTRRQLPIIDINDGGQARYTKPENLPRQPKWRRRRLPR